MLYCYKNVAYTAGPRPITVERRGGSRFAASRWPILNLGVGWALAHAEPANTPRAMHESISKANTPQFNTE